MKEKLKDRYTILGIVFILIGAIIVTQLANLQIVKGEYYDSKSQKGLLREDKIKAPRGKIVDRYGVPIAENRMGFNVQIVKTEIKNDQLNQMLLELSKVIEKNNDTYNKSFSKYLTFNPIDFGKALSQLDDKVEALRKKTGFRFKDLDANSSARQVFDYFRKEAFKIDPKYTDEEAYKIMTMRFEILGYTAIYPVSLAEDVSQETVAEIDERHHDFSGVTTEVEPVRKYADAQLAAHVVGYVRGITDDQLKKKKDDGYTSEDIIGQSGVEAAEEAYLRGKDGQKRVEVDTSGRLTQELGGNPAIPGDDVVLTMDMKLQKVAMESLESNIKKIRESRDDKGNFGDADTGAVVAMDVKTGEILAMASYPGYDPSVFLEGASNKEAQKTITELNDPKNELRPLFNRVLQGVYAPGSTFKPITAIAGLEEKAITPTDTIYDSGVTIIGGMKFYCLEYRMGLSAHGAINLERALATSCNIYFHELGYKVGIDSIDKWARYFGLGEKTGIDIDSSSESKGILASMEYKKKAYKDDWRPADTAQAAIGQLYNAFTPLQLVDYVSALANGGRLFKPHLVKRIVKYDGSIVTEKEPEFGQIPVSQESLNAVRNGMVEVANSVEGTAAEAFSGFPYKVAGKTGTAETGNEANHSSNALFVCYAPADDPQIAVAVVVEHGAWGAYTAPIARDVLTEYFGLNNQSSIEDKVKADEIQFTR